MSLVHEALRKAEREKQRKLGSTLGTVDVDRVREIVPAQDFGSVLQARIPGVRSIGMGALVSE